MRTLDSVLLAKAFGTDPAAVLTEATEAPDLLHHRMFSTTHTRLLLRIGTTETE